MRITIRDVSEAAGVSFKTVSRVINDERHVRPATRARVEAAIRDLNFRPSYAARALAGAKSFQIALLYDNPSPYYVHNIQIGVRARCMEQRIRSIAQPCDLHSPDLLAEIGALIDETHIDGIILAPPLGDIALITNELDRRGVDYVRIAAMTRLPGQIGIRMDDEAAAAEMTRHLLDLGHRRIGFLLGHPDHVSTGQRWNGFFRTMRAAGIDVDRALVASGRFDFERGREATAALLDLPAPPTAIFASNDDMAAGAIMAAHQRGLAIPEQLSVTGFDDIDLARAVWPPLTTIRQPIRDMGYAAADLLLGSGAAAGGTDRELKYEMVVRSSTARVRSA